MPGQPVTDGASLCCSFGTAPMPLLVTSNRTITLSGRPLATVEDSAPFANIPPFARCLSPAHPLGRGAGTAGPSEPALTAPPCTPIATGPWSMTSPLTTINGIPALQQSATWVCGYAGVVRFADSESNSTD